MVTERSDLQHLERLTGLVEKTNNRTMMLVLITIEGHDNVTPSFSPLMIVAALISILIISQKSPLVFKFLISRSTNDNDRRNKCS